MQGARVQGVDLRRSGVWPVLHKRKESEIRNRGFAIRPAAEFRRINGRE